MKGRGQAPRRLKVLQVAEATTAGVGRHLLDLSAAILAAGHDLRVACPAVREGAQHDVSLVERLREAGIPVHIVPMRRGIHPLADLRSAISLLNLIRALEPDLVHAHSSKAGALGRLVSRAARGGGARPITVYTPNAFAFSGARSWGARQLFRGIERWLGWHATDALICVSRSELDQARSHAITAQARMVLIENAIDVGRFAVVGDPAKAKVALGLDSRRPVVGFIGRLSRQKGVNHFVEAAIIVLEAAVDAQFLLVGEGEMWPELQKRVRKSRVEDSVLMIGHRTDIETVMAALDIFVLPSLYEGLPYTLMEAMAAGRPVIATRVRGNRDLIVDGENGLLVPPGDPAALAESVIHLLSAPQERKRLADGAQAAARMRPGPQEMAARVIDLYQGLLEESEHVDL
jgi:glycosyltransferase involved in cell wall biosynthesis